MPTCTLPDICQKVLCLDNDVSKLWDEVFGGSKSVFIGVGNIGVPRNDDELSNVARFQNDSLEYGFGAAIINSLNPKGVFCLGGMNFDKIEEDVSYELYRQELKIVDGFSSLYSTNRFYPVIGLYDYWPGANMDFILDPVPPLAINGTVLRMFQTLPDAVRYYSVYDDASSTEFFVLSGGKYKDFANHATSGLIYDDTSLDSDQYTWFSQRAESSPAKNKVVLFASPFVSISKAMYEDDNKGDDNVFTDFADWDFQSFGIRLIINGHSGNSFHLRKGSIDIVNCSSFIKSQFGFMLRDSEQTIGIPGWSIEYRSEANPDGQVIEDIYYPDQGNTPADYIVPRNEIFKMTCRKSGILCQFISYDPCVSSYTQSVESMNVEHEFEITPS